MGGKSVYIRQVALLQLLAQIGCFVPASRATFSVADAVLTRMGASDSLALGSSTFQEEMAEASAILAAATPRSLVICDELGRGTSTVDGAAVAAAVAEHLAHVIKPLTLFVTHFQGVARAAERRGGGAVANAHVSFASSSSPPAPPGPTTSTDSAPPPPDTGVTFLYKLTPGVSPSSFGLNVARLAGVPGAVVAAAAAKAAAAEARAARGALAAAARAAMKCLRAEGEGEGEGGEPSGVGAAAEVARQGLEAAWGV